MSVCVCEEGGREGGGRGADTELKTKTPHVNVGNNRNECCDNKRNDDDTTKRNTKLLGALGPYAWPMAM